MKRYRPAEPSKWGEEYGFLDMHCEGCVRWERTVEEKTLSMSAEVVHSACEVCLASSARVQQPPPCMSGPVCGPVTLSCANSLLQYTLLSIRSQEAEVARGRMPLTSL